MTRVEHHQRQQETPLAVGAFKTRPAGNAVIRLQHAEPGGTFNVYTQVGPRRVEDWCRQYGDFQEARDAAEHTRLAFRRHGTDIEIARCWERIARCIADLAEVEQTPDVIAKLDQLDAGLAKVETLAQRAARIAARRELRTAVPA